jgi:glutamyl-tRNA synthetase/nondiscriminating glutamyl-tRNA synthetase
MNIRVRFAPSPTGKLHIGNARTAILNELFAKHFKGRFILRLEDTDPERSQPKYTSQLLEILKWLGINWDEGPFYQSQRLEHYNNYAQKLLDRKQAYYCYCTQQELEAERKLCLSKGVPPRYSGKCRFLTETKKQQYQAQGKKPAIRFLVPEESIEWVDILKGKMCFLAEEIGDFIIIRSNGLPAYNFAVVIDDALMQISHVIRGEDHLVNTASQLLLYKALELSSPVFAHHPLILGPDRTKLSKRHGAVSVEAFKEEGFLPCALFYYLATVGTGASKKILSKQKLIAQFDLKKMGRGNAIFDKKRLLWLNRYFLRTLPINTIVEYAKPFLNKIEIKKAKEILAIIRDNIETPKEIKDYLPIFTQPEIELTKEEEKALKRDINIIIITKFLEKECSLPLDITIDQIEKETGLDRAKIMLTLRLALTGHRHGPGLAKIVEYLPKDWIRHRLKKVINNLC